MRALTELDNLLLIQAFDGRPLHTEYDPSNDCGVIHLSHENGQHECTLMFYDHELDLLRQNLAGFKHYIADPMIHNLDSAAYPQRWERLMPTFRRAAELMAEQDGRSAR